MLISMLICPYLDDANSILVNSPQTTLNPFKQVQNSAAGLILHWANSLMPTTTQGMS